LELVRLPWWFKVYVGHPLRRLGGKVAADPGLEVAVLDDHRHRRRVLELT
jgi:hypothetical protein